MGNFTIIGVQPPVLETNQFLATPIAWQAPILGYFLQPEVGYQLLEIIMMQIIILE